MSAGLRAWAVEGIAEVTPGTDLVALLQDVDLLDGDVVLVTSKVVSKAEGRSGPGDRDRAVAEETRRVVARRGPTRIVENHLGLVMAAAGVDASNVQPGHVVRLPLDPDASAAGLRARLLRERGVRVAVVVTDTAGRAWREGQTDLAVGVAGIAPLQDLSGTTDGYGNPLVVTAPAVADELAGLAELVTGKLGGRPVSVVRGLADAVLPADDDGPGARALQRPRHQDLFALGAREAVVAAVAGTDADCFGAPAPREELAEALARCGMGVGAGSCAGVDPEDLVVALPDQELDRGRLLARLELLAHAHGWRVEAASTGTTQDRARLRSGDLDRSA